MNLSDTTKTKKMLKPLRKEENKNQDYDFISNYIDAEELIADGIQKITQAIQKEVQYQKVKTGKSFDDSPIKTREALISVLRAISKHIKYRLEVLG